MLCEPLWQDKGDTHIDQFFSSTTPSLQNPWCPPTNQYLQEVVARDRQRKVGSRSFLILPRALCDLVGPWAPAWECDGSLDQRPSLLGFEGRNSRIRKIRIGKDFSSCMIPWHYFFFKCVDHRRCYHFLFCGSQRVRLLGDNISGKAVCSCTFGTGRCGWFWVRWISEGFFLGEKWWFPTFRGSQPTLLSTYCRSDFSRP